MFKFLKNSLYLIKKLIKFSNIILVAFLLIIVISICTLIFIVYAPIVTLKIIIWINYYLNYIKNSYDTNFLLLSSVNIFLFVIITSKIYFYKSLLLYAFLIFNIVLFIFFNLNSFVGILILVELMTVTYINILVFNFTNFLNILKNNKQQNLYFYILYALLIFLDKTTEYKFNFNDANHNYYPNEWFDNNDYIGIYLYMYFDNTFFLYFSGINFIFITVFFIKIFFTFFKEKINTFFLMDEHLKNIFQKASVNFYEKNWFWEKNFYNLASIFK